MIKKRKNLIIIVNLINNYFNYYNRIKIYK